VSSHRSGDFLKPASHRGRPGSDTRILNLRQAWGKWCFSKHFVRLPVTAIAFSLASFPQGTIVILWHGCREFFFLVFVNIRRNVALSNWIPHRLYENPAIMLYLLKWWTDFRLPLCLNLYIFYVTEQIVIIWGRWPIQMPLHTSLTDKLVVRNISSTLTY
jgi:hypothetical protein